MNSYPSMGSASSIAQFYQQAAAVSAAGGVGMDSLGSACSQLSSGALSSVGTGQALSEITRHPWLVPTGEFNLFLRHVSINFFMAVDFPLSHCVRSKAVIENAIDVTVTYPHSSIFSN